MKNIKTIPCILIVMAFALAQYLSSCSNTKELACPDFNQQHKHAKWYDVNLFSRKKPDSKIEKKQSGTSVLNYYKQIENDSTPDSKTEGENIIIQEDIFVSNEKVIPVVSKKKLKSVLETALALNKPGQISMKKNIETPFFSKKTQQPKYEISEGLAVAMSIVGCLFMFIGLIYGLLGSLGMMFIFGSVLAIPLSVVALITHPDNGIIWACAGTSIFLGIIFALSYLSAVGWLTGALAKGIFYTLLISLIVWAMYKGGFLHSYGIG